MTQDIIDQIIESDVKENEKTSKNEFLGDFLLEAKEYTENIEMSLMELENDNTNHEILNNIFRSMHSLKGLSGFVSQEIIEKIAHTTESLLSKIRKKEIIITQVVIDKLLLSVDFINKICINLNLNNNEKFISEVEKHIKELVEITENNKYLNYLKVGEILENELKIDKEDIEKILKLQKNKKYKELKFGEIAMLEKIVEPKDIADAIAQQLSVFLKISQEKTRDIPKLGEILTENEIINTEDLEFLIEKQNTEYKGKKLGEIALKEKKATPEDIADALRVQNRYSSFVESNKNEFYVKIPIVRLDDLVNTVGELMILHSQIVQEFHKDGEHNPKLIRSEKIIKNLQQTAMQLRMITLKSVFQKIKRIGRDAIQQLNKNAEIFIYGAETEIDRDIADKLITPLTHLVKNAVAHGLEKEEERVKNGKNSVGKIILKAFSKRGNVYIRISDDGRGLDVKKIYQTALDKNLIDRDKKYSDDEIMDFIFFPGFSTKEDVDKISGRGVGLDVVSEEIRKVSGKIDIKSCLGKGVEITLKIPINMAALNGTVVTIAGAKFIVPTNFIKEIIKNSEDINVELKGEVKYCKIRGNIVPIVSNKNILGLESSEKILIVLEVEGKYRVLKVDEVVERREIVVKPIGEDIGNLNCISGASILGDGRVALILDVESFFK